jgi:hypothetical protein
MVSNTAVALLSAGCLLTMPALAFAQDDLMAKARQQFEPIPAAAPELPGNAATPRKVELGNMLYFDPRLSANNKAPPTRLALRSASSADASPRCSSTVSRHMSRAAEANSIRLSMPAASNVVERAATPEPIDTTASTSIQASVTYSSRKAS